MGIEAVYGFNEYIKAAVTAGGQSSGNFYPGRMAPLTETSNVFVTYRVSPNDVYDLYGLKEDDVAYTFYNPSFDALQKTVRLALAATNVENIQTTSLSETGVTYKDATMRIGAPGESADVDGTEYYFVNATVKLMYVEA